MSTGNRLVLAGVLALAVALVVALRHAPASDSESLVQARTGAPAAEAPNAAASSEATVAAAAQPPAPARAGHAAVPAMRDAPVADAARSAGPTRASASSPAPALPRLVDVGADKCIPCRAMAPILEALEREFAGRLRVDFVDLWKHPDEAEPFKVYGIPTQIFFDPSGRELHRHLGFISKEEILATWKMLGFPLTRAEKG